MNAQKPAQKPVPSSVPQKSNVDMGGRGQKKDKPFQRG